MANALGRLLGRHASRHTPQEGSAGDVPAVDIDALPLEGALDELPVLVPAAIYHQLMFAPNEITPAWLTPRPSPAPVAASSMVSTVESKPAKRTRRPKAIASTTTSRPKSKPKRGDATTDQTTNR